MATAARAASKIRAAENRFVTLSPTAIRVIFTIATFGSLFEVTLFFWTLSLLPWGRVGDDELEGVCVILGVGFFWGGGY